jgi:hypothetical protein
MKVPVMDNPEGVQVRLAKRGRVNFHKAFKFHLAQLHGRATP